MSGQATKQILPPFLREGSRQEVIAYTEKSIARWTLDTLDLLDQVAERRLFEIYLKKRLQWIETLPSLSMQQRILERLQLTERGSDSLGIHTSEWDPDRRRQVSERLIELDRAIQYQQAQQMYDQLWKIVVVGLGVLTTIVPFVGVLKGYDNFQMMQLRLISASPIMPLNAMLLVAITNSDHIRKISQKIIYISALSFGISVLSAIVWPLPDSEETLQEWFQPGLPIWAYVGIISVATFVAGEKRLQDQSYDANN